jgi:hypothetical protein
VDVNYAKSLIDDNSSDRHSTFASFGKFHELILYQLLKSLLKRTELDENIEQLLRMYLSKLTLPSFVFSMEEQSKHQEQTNIQKKKSSIVG